MMARRRGRRALAGLALALALAAAAWALLGPAGAIIADRRDQALALVADKAAPLFARWLAASADQAHRDGVQPMPAEIRQALLGFVDERVLGRVRYRIGGGTATSVQTAAFLHPQTRAVSLDDIIVFRNAENAAKPRYWVHEIVHLEQIRRLGLEGFARQYLHDTAGIEREAWELTDRYVAWALRRELEAATTPAGAGG